MIDLDDTKEGELLGILASTKNSPKVRGNAAGELAFRIGRMKSEIERLRRDCAQAYQVIGAAMLGDPAKYTQDDVVRALDNLSAAANGQTRPHDDLLPWPKEG